MPKINQEEYEVLKELDDKWKWIVRNEDRCLYARTEKPVRKDGPSPYWGTDWWDADPYGAIELFDEKHLFQFIQWSNSEPFNIAELIEEYEEHEFYNYVGWEYYKSEESEVKTLESIREEIWEEMLRLEDKRKDQWTDIKYQTLREVLQKLGHLGEPEVLSQEWIDENKTSIDRKLDGTPIYKVREELLQNLLVPKQELPVIPNYVAKWISEHHKKFDLYPALRRLEEGSTRDYDAYKWYRRNTHTFVNAYLTGKYEVEEEQKYVVKLPMSKNNDNQYAIVDYSGNIWVDALPSKYKLTEEEIRGLTKGDVLFEHFAVKAEELEE